MISADRENYHLPPEIRENSEIFEKQRQFMLRSWPIHKDKKVNQNFTGLSL
jgi:hypothetical protein